MQLSAFVDGELPENEAELLLRRMSQDAELRQQVAEYLAIGRAMRGDAQVPGIDRLRERVANALGEPLSEEITDDAVPGEHSYLRPVVGVAVAAGVALVAIFALSQVSSFDDGVPANDDPLAATPDAADFVDELRLRHDIEDLDFDSTRLVDFEATEEFVEIPAAGSQDADDEPDEDELEAADSVATESAVE